MSKKVKLIIGTVVATLGVLCLADIIIEKISDGKWDKYWEKYFNDKADSLDVDDFLNADDDCDGNLLD